MPFGGALTAALIGSGSSILGGILGRPRTQQTTSRGNTQTDTSRFYGEKYGAPTTAPIPPELMEQLLAMQGMYDPYIGQYGSQLQDELSGRNRFLDWGNEDLSAMYGLLPGLENFINRGQLEHISPRGLAPETLAALNAQAVEDTQSRFQGAEGRLRQDAARRGLIGGNMPGAGEYIRQAGGLETGRERLRADLLRKVPLEQQAALDRNLATDRGFWNQRRASELQGYGQYSDILTKGLAGRLQAAGLFNPGMFSGGLADLLGGRSRLMPPVMPTVFPRVTEEYGSDVGSSASAGTQPPIGGGGWGAAAGAGLNTFADLLRGFGNPYQGMGPWTSGGWPSSGGGGGAGGGGWQGPADWWPSGGWSP